MDEIKKKALNYLCSTGIGPDIEKCLNKLVLDTPADARGYLSLYFEECCHKWHIERIEAHECLDPYGLPGLGIKVIGSFRNVPNQVIVETRTPSFWQYSKKNRKAHSEWVAECVSVINSELGQVLVDQINKDLSGVDEEDSRDWRQITDNFLRQNVLERQEIFLKSLAEEKAAQNDQQDTAEVSDRKQKGAGRSPGGKKSGKKGTNVIAIEPDDPPPVKARLLRCHFSLSLAITLAEWRCLKPNQTLCEVLNNKTVDRTVTEGTDDKTAVIPLPLIPVLANGKLCHGKCNIIRRCYLIPMGIYGPLRKISEDICAVGDTLKTNLINKNIVHQTLETGELVPVFDRPEQYFDILSDAIRENNVEGKIKVMVEVDGTSLFDYDKGKYEVIAGQQKGGEEVGTMLLELIRKYETIVAGVIDPFRQKELEAWKKLGTSLTEDKNEFWIFGTSRNGLFPGVSNLPQEIKTDTDISTTADATITNDDDNIVTDATISNRDHKNQLDHQQEQRENENVSVPTAVEVSVHCLEVDWAAPIQDHLDRAHQLIESGQLLGLWCEEVSYLEWLLPLAQAMGVRFVRFPATPTAGQDCCGRYLDQWIAMFSSSYHQIDSSQECVEEPTDSLVEATISSVPPYPQLYCSVSQTDDTDDDKQCEQTAAD